MQYTKLVTEHCGWRLVTDRDRRTDKQLSPH